MHALRGKFRSLVTLCDEIAALRDKPLAAGVLPR